MKRSEVLARLPFQVPDIKKKRVIVHSDIAANFEWRYREGQKLHLCYGK